MLAQSSRIFAANLTPEQTIAFSLTYANMSSPVVQAHIHFGANRTDGGVAVFPCGGQKPACPASGTVTGTITAAEVSTLPVTSNGFGHTPGYNSGRHRRFVRGHSGW